MSAFAGPNSVESGLVFCLDAINVKSYPGSGTSWTNLTDNSTTTVSGTVAYSSGYITFDGSTTYADFSVSGLSTTTTVEMFVRIKSVTNASGFMPFGWNTYDVWTGANLGALGYNTANGDVYGIPGATVTSLGIVNNWKHIIFEMRSDVSYTNNKIYVNAVSQTLSQVTGTENATYRTFNSGLGRIAGWRFDTNYKMNMDLATFRIYNRALLETEVRQNYNALKGRFGL